MTKAQIRVELLRIAFQQVRDDRTALTYAQHWEEWVLEALEQDAPPPSAEPAKPAKAKPSA